LSAIDWTAPSYWTICDSKFNSYLIIGLYFIYDISGYFEASQHYLLVSTALKITLLICNYHLRFCILFISSILKIYFSNGKGPWLFEKLVWMVHIFIRC
jgi:hypothetical protein